MKSIFIIIIFYCEIFYGKTNAQISCRSIYDPRYPGLQECKVSINMSLYDASPPVPQKMSLWCWAASLSAIFNFEGHPISQDQIVIQNFGKIENAPGGNYLQFESRINRDYIDDNGVKFTSTATNILTTEDAANALNGGIPILYTMTTHATVQIALTYQHAPGGPYVTYGGRVWDPEPSIGYTNLSASRIASFIAAWSITTN